MEEEQNTPPNDVEVWEMTPSATPLVDIPEASKEDAAKSLKDLYEELKSAPKYLRPSQFAKPYNEAKQRFDRTDYAFVLREVGRIRSTLKNMKQEYHDLALKIMRVRDQIQGSQKAGLTMDYDALLKMLDKCVNVLKLGKLDSGSRLIEKFVVTFDQQLEGSIGPVKQQAFEKLNGINVMIQEAKQEGLDTELEEHQLSKMLESVKVAQTMEDVKAVLDQTDAVTELLEFSKSEQKLKDELPKQASQRIQAVRASLFDMTKANMDVENIIELYDECSEMFSAAQSEEDFNNLNVKLEELETLVDTNKTFLEQIAKERALLTAELLDMRERVQELTYLGYIVASMSNRLDKMEKKLNTTATEGVLKETERSISNLKNELDSIMEQEIDEFNLKMRLLMDFEVLGDLCDQLPEPIDKVEDFIMEFSMMFAEAPSTETYMSMNESMGISLRLVKQGLGMEIEEEEGTLPEDDTPIELEQLE